MEMHDGFETIVVGVDFSKYSELAVKQAFLLARTWKAKVILCHVFTELTHLKSDVYSTAHESMSEILQGEIKKKFLKNGRQAEIFVQMGTVEESLIQIASQAPHPLILIGHRGLSRFQKFFLGSNAERLAKQSPYPVWVQMGEKTASPKRVLVPCEISRSFEKVTKKVSFLRRLKNSNTDLFYVFPPVTPYWDYLQWVNAEESMLNDLNKKLEKIKMDYSHLKVKQTQGDVAAEICKASKNYDLIVMHAHEGRFMFPALGSVTAKVLRLSTKPVLVIPV